MQRSQIVILGASLKNYARVDTIIAALEKIGDATIISTPTPDKPYRLSFLWHLVKALGRALTIHIPSDTDFVVIPFTDNENVWTSRLYRFIHQRHYKIIFDPFISIYDTYVYNKPLAALSYPIWGSLLRWWLHWYESYLFNSADILLTDTDNHGRYLTQTLGIKKKFHKLLISADEERFVPTRLDDPSFWQQQPLQVVWYGKISLMHGVDYIWDAVEALPAGSIVITLIGDFSKFDQEKIARWQKEGKLQYLAEKPPHYVGQAKIIKCIQKSHVSLGMFGRTEKSTNVITNKEYEALCAGRCLVTLKGHREFLQHEYNCLMVNPHKATELVEMLQILDRDRIKAQRIAQQGRRDYLAYASEDQLHHNLRAILTTALPVS